MRDCTPLPSDLVERLPQLKLIAATVVCYALIDLEADPDARHGGSRMSQKVVYMTLALESRRDSLLPQSPFSREWNVCGGTRGGQCGLIKPFSAQDGQ